MKKTTLATILMLAFSMFSLFQACKNDDDDDTEFVADNNTFKNYGSWALEATHSGPDPALGPAHGGNDSTVVRNVYFEDGQDPVGGKYPTGTVIVKHSSNGSSVDERIAMVKRGNGFSPATNDWEWFVLASDGTIAKDPDGNLMRGANLLNGLCTGCHTQAASKDYVFSK